jgi:hypothetical protein
MVDQNLVAKAQEVLPNLSYLASLYDLHFAWANTDVLTISKYTLDEFTRLRNLDIIEDTSEAEARNKFMDRVTKGEGQTVLVCKTKDQKRVRLNADFTSFTYNDEQFMAGKITEIGYLNPDGTYTQLNLNSLKQGVILPMDQDKDHSAQ